jgi:hypothetical protein
MFWEFSSQEHASNKTTLSKENNIFIHQSIKNVKT